MFNRVFQPGSESVGLSSDIGCLKSNPLPVPKAFPPKVSVIQG